MPRKRERNGKKIALFTGVGCFGLVLLLVAGVVVIGITDPGNSRLEGSDSEIFESGKGFKPNAPINPRTLAATDAESIFWTMFQNQSERPVTYFEKQFFRDRKELDDPAQRGFSFDGVRQTRVDFGTQRITTGESTYEPVEGIEHSLSGKMKLDDQSRCIGETNHMGNQGSWKADKLSGIQCLKSGMNVHAGDGIAPGGLSENEANDYIDYIKNSSAYEKNPVSVGKPTPHQHRGKQYIRLPVKVSPVHVKEYQSYSGMMIFLWGMKHIGKDPAGGYLYSSFGAGGSGAEITYFIDPRTTLPAFMTMQETPGLEKDGKTPQKVESLGFKRVEYEFPQQWKPFRLDDPESLKPFTMEWPPTVP